jgi:hypothetical protein
MFEDDIVQTFGISEEVRPFSETLLIDHNKRILEIIQEKSVPS